ncbi:type I-E CRISPR-associated protein Cas7/Cse4/CasC [Salmonella enterica subsp. enterica]|nr:type I-E CRISPR-associated protein Cas7/Cse4/CasC [Salmonella enterica subsp. enterica]
MGRITNKINRDVFETTFTSSTLLTGLPRRAPNCDDTGALKTVVFGGATRLRISSQSLKRAGALRNCFGAAGNIGIRKGVLREAVNRRRTMLLVPPTVLGGQRCYKKMN